MSDQQVIDEILLGNQSMFRLLVEKYQSMVFTTAMGFVHSKEDAEDQIGGGTDGSGQPYTVGTEGKHLSEVVHEGEVDHGNGQLCKEGCDVQDPELDRVCFLR